MPPVQAGVQAAVDAAEGAGRFQLRGLERHAFYARAAKAYCVVRSTERAFYGCARATAAHCGADARGLSHRHIAGFVSPLRPAGALSSRRASLRPRKPRAALPLTFRCKQQATASHADASGPKPPIYFWPQPISVAWGAGAAAVSPALTFTLSPPGNPDLAAYAARIAAEVFVHAASTPAPATQTREVTITVADASAALSISADESYTLSVPADGSAIAITAATNYGAYHALQTLSQAVRFDFATQQYGVVSAPLTIADKPKFAWRGILVDTDRHWLSLHHLQRVIEGLAMSKLNVLVRWAGSSGAALVFPVGGGGAATHADLTLLPPLPLPLLQHWHIVGKHRACLLANSLCPHPRSHALMLRGGGAGRVVAPPPPPPLPPPPQTGRAGRCRASPCRCCGARRGPLASATRCATWRRSSSLRAREVCAWSPSS